MEKDVLLKYMSSVDRARTVEEACRAAVSAIADYTRFSNPSLFLVDPEGQNLVLVAHVGFTPGTLTIPRGRGISWISLETGKSALIDDVTLEKDYLPGLEGSRCELNVPVIWRDRKIGVFSIESRVPGAFTTDDARFANLLAAILGSVIVHLETETRLSESLKDLEMTARYRSLFLELFFELFSMRERDVFLDRVVDILGEVMKYDKIYLFLRQTRSGPLWLRAFRGKNVGEKAIRDILEKGRGITGRAIRTGTAVFCNDTSKDPDFYLDDTRTQSEAALPIRFGDTLWGVLLVDEYRPDAFSPSDREQLTILAGMIGVVLENIHQFRRLQEELSLMESVHRIITAVAGERDLRDLCGETVRLLRDNTRYNFVEVYEVLSRITGEVRMIGGGPEEDGSCWEQEDLLRERGWGLVGLAARTGRLVNVPDVRDSPQYVPIKRTTRSELDVPIEFGGNLYGILSLESDIPGAFTEDDERAMSILSGHLGVLWAHRELLDRTERQAMQDPLTGLWNRRFIFGRLDAEIARCERYGCRFSIAMIDLVNFKSVNDRFGHTTGDRVLAETGSFFARSLRACDMVARYGGDEFLVLLPEADLDEAMCIVERLLERYRGLTFCGGEVQVSFDFGIASFPADGRDSGSLVRKADENLYGQRGIITRPGGG